MTRKQFEEFLASPPYEQSAERWPIDPSPYVAWPGHYKVYAVQLAWEVLEEAKRLKNLREAGEVT